MPKKLRPDAELKSRPALGHDFTETDHPVVSALSFEHTLEVVSMGSLKLNLASGVGGMPMGIIARVYGPQGVGKSAIMYRITANAKRQGINVLWIDAEYSYDPARLRKEGITDDAGIYVTQADNAAHEFTVEDACNMIQDWLYSKQGEHSIIILDSYEALSSNQRIEAGFSAALISDKAKVMAAAIEQFPFLCATRKATLIIVSQVRADMNAAQTHREYKLTGGYPLAHATKLAIDLKPLRQETSNEGVVFAQHVLAFFAKNKVAGKAWSAVEIVIRNDVGIDTAGELIDLGIALGIMRQTGAWIAWHDEKWNGAAKARLAILDSPSLAHEIEAEIMNATRAPGTDRLFAKKQPKADE